jgi:predicted HTH domain antitoxin
MSMRRVSVELELPEELLAGPDALALLTRRVREGVTMDLVRRGVVSRGKAAEMLGLDPWVLADLMASHAVPYFDLLGEDFTAGVQVARDAHRDDGA